MPHAHPVGSSSVVEVQHSSLNPRLASLLAKLTGKDSAGAPSLSSWLTLGSSVVLLAALAIYTAATFTQSGNLYSSIQFASRFVNEAEEVRRMVAELELLEERHGMRTGYPDVVLVDSAREQVNTRLMRLDQLSTGFAPGIQTLPRLNLQKHPQLTLLTRDDAQILTAAGYLSQANIQHWHDEPSFNLVSERLEDANFLALTTLDRQLARQKQSHQNWTVASLLVLAGVSILLILEIVFLRRRALAKPLFRSNSVSTSLDESRPLSQAAEKVRFDTSEAVQAALAAERARIGRDIHDDLGVHLMTLKIVLKCASKSAKTNFRRSIDSQWSSLLGHVDMAMESVARVAEKLRPKVTNGMGIRAALESHIRQFEEVTHIPCDLHVDAEHLPVSDASADDVFRIVQEALTNVARHAEASSVEVRIQTEDHCLNVAISDNGKGISTNNILSPVSMGLRGMLDRAQAIGGELRILGRPEGGTTIALRVPEAMTS